MHRGVQFGIDVGGTFTDILVRDRDSGSILAAFKVPSTPSAPDKAILNGIDKYFSERDATSAGSKELAVFHATTVGTNTLIERKGARTALITTKGFRDILALRRQVRPKLYDLAPRISEPLVSRPLRIEIDERMGFDGGIIRPLETSEIDRVVKALANENVKSVAICLIHAYANAEHEILIADAIKRELSGIYVTTSADVCPEFREFERASTVVVNAYIGPIVQDYMKSLRDKLNDRGSKSLSIVKSNGGLTSATNAGRYPVHLIESGPAAGIMAAAALAQKTGYKNLICFDMGGTTAKVGVVTDGQPRLTTEFYADRFVDGEDMGGYPIKSPVIDIIEIGAGGGSIASAALGGLIKVGPQSAGSVPGPACYGHGGTEPTITDAHLIIGNLSSEAYGPGNIRLDKNRAVDAMKNSIGSKLGWSIERAAHGVVALATAHMIEMVRVATLQRGVDPREFALLAYGGAGPLHACDIANEIGITKVIIPPYPGLFSAIGTLLGDVRHDFVKTLLRDMTVVKSEDLEQGFEELVKKAAAVLANEEARSAGAAGGNRQLSVDVRYKGQLFEVNIPVPDNDSLSALALDGMFREKYKDLYGYELPGHATEIVNLRLVVTLGEGAVDVPSFSPTSSSQPAQRPVYDADGTATMTRVIARDQISDYGVISGPCIIEDVGATVCVRANQSVRSISLGGLLIESAAQ